MCGRFDVDARNPEIQELAARLPPASREVKFGEIFPGNVVMAIGREGNRESPLSYAWGFPKKDSKGLIINARAESALDKPFFSYALRNNPLAIPITAFFEWRKNDAGKHKEKFIFRSADNDVFYLAGFGRFFKEDEPGERLIVLTTEANPSMEPFHHRMPVLLRREEVAPWLAGETRKFFLERLQMPLKATPADEH